MVSCEMCGKDVSSLKKVNVSGSVMSLCQNCAVYGKAQDEKVNSQVYYRRKREDDKIFDVKENCISLIQKALIQEGYDTHQLARGVGIREGELNKYLSSKIKMDVGVAKRIGSFLKINLLEEAKFSDTSSYLADEEEDSKPMTLGDELLKKLREAKK